MTLWLGESNMTRYVKLYNLENETFLRTKFAELDELDIPDEIENLILMNLGNHHIP